MLRFDADSESLPLERDRWFESVLVSGGDSRLLLDPDSGVNMYGAAPYARPEDISFSSSTASTISKIGYGAALDAFLHLRSSERSNMLGTNVSMQTRRLQAQMASLFDLTDQEPEIIFSPSGTDSQLHALFVASSLLGDAVTSIVVASDETGGGTAHAAAGCHFSVVTANGISVRKGQSIRGWPDAKPVVSIPVRDENGALRLRDELDGAVIDAVSTAVKNGKSVLLYAMAHSKTGLSCPSRSCLTLIRERWSGVVQIVVDACQFRLDATQIRTYLKDGDMLLLTGSKFFGGPPFSGALLVPKELSKAMQNVEKVPLGLADYATQLDWPIAWGHVRTSLTQSANIGQLLRWTSALAEIKRYMQVPAAARNALLASFEAIVAEALTRYPSFVPLYGHGFNDSMSLSSQRGAATIVPFLIYRDGRPLTLNRTRRLHQALACLPPEGAGASLYSPADAVRYHLGQPVAISTRDGVVGALRVSCGARNVIDLVSDLDRGDVELRSRRLSGQIICVLDRLQYLANRMDGDPEQD